MAQNSISWLVTGALYVVIDVKIINNKTNFTITINLNYS